MVLGQGLRMVRSSSASEETASEETASIEFLVNQFRQIESQPVFDGNRWKLLKAPIAATPATNLAGAIEKLRIVHAEMEIDADELDLKILRSAITDLETLSETT